MVDSEDEETFAEDNVPDEKGDDVPCGVDEHEDEANSEDSCSNDSGSSAEDSGTSSTSISTSGKYSPEHAQKESTPKNTSDNNRIMV